MQYLTKKKFLLYVFIYSVTSFLVLILSLYFGTENISFIELIKSFYGGISGLKARLFYYQRLPRVILGFIAGGTFALTGLCYQNVFKNPLATPFTTGITSGGTLGAVIAISFSGINLNLGFISEVQLFSLLGSLLILAVIFILSKKKRNFANTLLLTGISMGILISAFVLLIRFLISPNILAVVDRWVMGGLNINGFPQLAPVFPFVLPGLLLLFSQAPKLNYLVSGDEMAISRGIDTDFITKSVLLGGTLATAGIVSVTGPIAFVGLIIPHIIKSISGYDMRVNAFAVFFTGGAFLAICDAVSRVIISPAQMPVGIFTAVIGGGYFIYLINFKKK